MNALGMVVDSAGSSLVSADSSWSILNLLDNANSLGEAIAAGVIMLMGLIALVYGIVKAMIKLMSQQNQDSWLKIGGAIIVGGAFMVGGFAMAQSIAAGGKQTIDDLGNGMIMFSQYYGLW